MEFKQLDIWRMKLGIANVASDDDVLFQTQNNNNKIKNKNQQLLLDQPVCTSKLKRKII